MKRTKKKIEMMRRSLRMNPEKVRRRLRRELYCLPLASIVLVFCIVFEFYFVFCCAYTM